METSLLPNSASTELIQLLRQGKTDVQIRELLVSRYGEDGVEVHQLMQELKKARSARNISTGLMIIFVGAVVLLMSCLLTILHFSQGSSLSFVLYGMTTIGILIVFWGLIKIFG